MGVRLAQGHTAGGRQNPEEIPDGLLESTRCSQQPARQLPMTFGQHGTNCAHPLTDEFVFQLTHAVQRVLFKGHLQGWESLPGQQPTGPETFQRSLNTPCEPGPVLSVRHTPSQHPVQQVSSLTPLSRARD